MQVALVWNCSLMPMSYKDISWFDGCCKGKDPWVALGPVRKEPNTLSLRLTPHPASYSFYSFSDPIDIRWAIKTVGTVVGEHRFQSSFSIFIFHIFHRQKKIQNLIPLLLLVCRWAGDWFDGRLPFPRFSFTFLFRFSSLACILLVIIVTRFASWPLLNLSLWAGFRFGWFFWAGFRFGGFFWASSFLVSLLSRFLDPFDPLPKTNQNFLHSANSRFHRLPCHFFSLHLLAVCFLW